MKTQFSAIILASGLSKRMRVSKPLLKWDNTTSFLEKIVSEFSKAGCRRIICTVNRHNYAQCASMNFPCDVKFVVNDCPQEGRIHSIRLAAQLAKEDDFCFVQNVDNPFVCADIIKKIFEKRSHTQWCSPIYNNKGGHPVLLPKFILVIISKMQGNEHTFHEILNQFDRKNVSVNADTVHRNINTQEDYQKYFGKKI